jgi:prephenate dehydrogenase
MTTSSTRRATVIGTGLIGGSIGAALRARGWHVSGADARPGAASRALELGVIDEVGIDPASEITFVATPVSVVAVAAQEALATTRGVVTDVGSVKEAVTDAVRDPRFVGGHPMAGSENLGVDGARADLFEGAVWTLTPRAHTSDEAYETVRSVVGSLGAEVLTLDPAQHDALVAVVSHVPHLTAASLMRLATERSEEHNALLRLAAGGFRDMTRVAAGSPEIWPDICTSNRSAILATLDHLMGELGRFRSLIDEGDRAGLLTDLTEAQAARRNLPSRATVPDHVTEVRIPVRDEPGQVAAVAVLATDLGVNLRSLQTVDAAEGGGGMLHVVLESGEAEVLLRALLERGYHPSSERLE